MDLRKQVVQLNKIMSEHTKIINDQSKQINELKSIAKSMCTPKQIAVHSSVNNNKRTYASISKQWHEMCPTPVSTRNIETSVRRSRISNIQKRKLDPILIVKPNEQIEVKDIESQIKNVMNPLSDPVKSIRQSSNGNIVITCTTDDDIDVVKNKLCDNISYNVDVSERKKVRPVVKLVVISEYDQSKKD